MLYLAGIVYLAGLFLGCRMYWRRYQRLTKQTEFRYAKSDVYAALASFVPSYMLTAMAFQGKDVGFGGALVVICTQVAGAFLGRLAIEMQPPLGRAGKAETALAVIVGSVCLLVAFVIVSAVLILVIESPVMALIIAGTFCMLLLWAKHR